MNRIYQKSKLEVGREIQLDKSASQHVLNVLRLRIGEELVLFNGDGGEYQAKIMGQTKQLAHLAIVKFDPVDREPALAIHLGQCLSRGERMDYAIQKSVEVGVAEITPLLSSRCNVKLADERIEKRLAHWHNIIISACEQSGRTCIPILNPPMELKDWMSQREGLGFVADFQQEPIMPDASIKQVNLLIGPEGGLTPDEIQLARHHQFKSLSLGKLTLRTETAPVVAISQLQLIFARA
jgi:16S rRNA (uracil1498-N3)-methyltransferase